MKQKKAENVRSGKVNRHDEIKHQNHEQEIHKPFHKNQALRITICYLLLILNSWWYEKGFLRDYLEI